MRTVGPSAGLSGGVEEAVGEEELEDGDEGQVTPLGLTSTFFSFRSKCLLLVPREREGNAHISSTMTMS